MPVGKDDLETLFARRREIDRALLEQHSRELTVLFTDIVGSTQYFEAKGDIAGLELVRRHNDMLFPVVRGHEGWIVKTIGDAILAVFEDPLQAARCAVAMQKALDAQNQAGGEPIHIRVGAHHGRALVEEGKDVFGDVVNTAARVVNQARADEIVISRTLADRLPEGSGIHLSPRGTFQPKGKTEALELVQVRWRDEDAEAEPHAVPKAQEIFVLEVQVGAKGLKVAALDGAADKGTVKAYADVEVSQAKLDQLSSRFGTFMKAGGSGSYVQRVRELGLLLMQSALSERAQRHVSQTPLQLLRLHLDDQLVHVPWELMHDGRDFLALKFAMGRMISARTETGPGIRLPATSDSAHALVVSNASGDLEAAVREGEAVAGLLRDGWAGEVRHIRGPVRRDDFLAALPGCALLHFAGHAEQPGPNGPGGLRLSDAVVSPEEVTQAVGTAAPALVFANSCHASSGDGFRAAEGSGPDLASSFLLRGARHFVGPRWDIADEDALTFALRFYERALSGQGFGEAVRLARHALMNPAARPLSFAGYVLYGDPRGTLPTERIRLRKEALTRSSGSGDNLPAVPIAVNVKGPPRRRRPYAAVVGVGVGMLVVGSGAALRLLTQKDQPTVPPIAAVAQPPEPPPVPRAVPEGPVRLCVLPFKNISGQAELDFLRDGLTEAVMTDFGQREGIRLIERAQIDLDIQELEFSNSKYVDPSTRAKIGEIHGAEVVVMGGFQRSGDRLRAHARFVNVETGEILHAVKVDGSVGARPDEALFALQDDLAARVREAVPVMIDRVRPE